MADCWNLMGVTNPSIPVHGISNAGDFLYVPTGTGIDRWSFPGFVQNVDWHPVAAGVQSLTVDNSDIVIYKGYDGHLYWWDGGIEVDKGVIGASDLVYSSHEDCLYGINGNSLIRLTLAGTETTIFTGSTFLVRPTISRGGDIWCVEGFTTLHRFDPDDSFSHTTTSTTGWFFTVPDCNKAGVRANGNAYSEGITVTTLVCTDVFNLFAAWTSGYNLIIGSDLNSGGNKVYQLKCGGIRPPLRIRQRNDDLLSGSPRIRAKSSSMQRSLRIYGSNSFA